MNHQRPSRRSSQGSARLQLRRFLSCLFTTLILVVSTAQLETLRAQTTGPALTVDVTANRHPISPNIYGMNSYAIDPALAQELHIPVARWGGDSATRYNWQVDSSNSGFDWYFIGGNGQSNPVPSASVDALVNTDKGNGSQTIVTIPIIPYVNKTSATTCSFPESIYGPQQSTNPYVHINGDNCGNSLRPDGSQIQDTNIYANHIDNSPSLMQGWVQHLTSKFGTAANGGVQFYQMDNEPAGWGNTHRDVHPNAPTYDEIVNLTTQYAPMVKANDKSAQILGPSDFGWPAYVGSGTEINAHGGNWNAIWYLQQMQAYEQQHGVRILNYFDEHYSPNGPGDDQWRLRSTRSLWDPTYTDESWIGQYYGAIQLIPRFKGWVNSYYPGTKIAISEYNWGALERLNGALAQADVLGIFGREGLDLATIWGPPTSTQPGAYAFRMYLNYDGKGSKFGETSISASSADQGQLAVYGAQRSSDKAVTLLMVNKTGNDLTSNLSLKGFTPGSTAQVYTYSNANLSAIVPTNLGVTGSSFSTTYPANSITLVVIPQGSGSSSDSGSTGSGTPLDQSGWSVTASSNAGADQMPAQAIDGNLSTRWSTGISQANGQYFQIDLGSSQSFSKLVLDATNSPNDYPAGYAVYVSNDGQNWGSAIASGSGSSAVTTISFSTVAARYIKIVQTGSSGWWWSIHELNVYASTSTVGSGSGGMALS